MPITAVRRVASYRIIQRKSVQECRALPSLRASILEPRFAEDAWIVPADTDVLALFLGDCRVVSISGGALESSALNQQLFALRNRPRRR